MLRKMNPDRLVRAIDREHNVRVAAVVTTTLCADAARRHQLSAGASIAVGRALTSGLLLATLTKGDERVTVQIIGDGPIGSITVDATGDGDVRGYALHGQAGTELKAGPPRISELVGRHGAVHVVRDLGLKELYQGQTTLVTGEVDEDMEAYLRVSEQVPSALGAEVVLDDRRGIVCAGGVLVQALPGGAADAVREAQHALRTGKLYEILKDGATAEALAKGIYTLGTLEFLGGERQVRFRCRCSAERIGEMLALLGTVDLDEMIAEGKPAEVLCNFCNTRYQIGRAELERIRANVAPRESN
jgi:molecular chaperone Hsp33